MTISDLLTERLVGRQVCFHYRDERIEIRVVSVRVLTDVVFIKNTTSEWLFPLNVYFEITG